MRETCYSQKKKITKVGEAHGLRFLSLRLFLELSPGCGLLVSRTHLI